MQLLQDSLAISSSFWFQTTKEIAGESGSSFPSALHGDVMKLFLPVTCKHYLQS